MNRNRRVTRGRLVAPLVGLALLATLQSASSHSSSGPAGCDISRAGVSYGPNTTTQTASRVVPCLTYTFPEFGEGRIVVTPPATLSNGATTPSAVMESATMGRHPNFPTVPTYGVARTVDEGAHWQNVMFPPNTTEVDGSRCAADSSFYRDPFTNRLFYNSDAQCDATGGLNIAFTDDNGETWVDNPGPPLQFFPVGDATLMFAGPPRTAASQAALNKAGYPDVVYLCGESRCFKSVDGGINFTEIKDSSGTDQAGSNGALIAGPDGTLYAAHLFSGASRGTVSHQLSVSRDEGTTWAPASGAFPTGFAPACTSPAGEGSLSVDKHGNLYLGGKTADGRLAISYSTDGGMRWASPIPLQMPGVVGIDLCSFDSDWNRPGHVAAAYMGAGNASGQHHGYLTKSDNIFASSPVFTGVQVDSDTDALLPYGPPGAFPPFPGQAAPKCFGCRADYMDVTFSPVDGAPWALYVKDECSTLACAGNLDPNKTRDSFWTNYVGAVGTMANS